MPILVLPALELGTIDLAQWRGNTLAINIWATWCAPCREELPMLEALHRSMSPEQGQLAGISVDDDQNLAREFAHALGLTFPLAFDATAARTRDTLGITQLPMTIIVAPDGRILRRIVGFSASTRAELTEALGVTPPRNTETDWPRETDTQHARSIP